MPRRFVIDADWLETAIRAAEELRAHAQSTGKPVAIAAAGVRLETLKEVRRMAAAEDATPPAPGGPLTPPASPGTAPPSAR